MTKPAASAPPVDRERVILEMRHAAELLGDTQVADDLLEWADQIEALAASAQVREVEACKTCNGVGLIGGCVGQTPESLEWFEEPCPDCPPPSKPAAEPAPVAQDFTPCRCGEVMDIYIHRVEAPYQLSGCLYVACCNKCGHGVPFVSFAGRAGVMPDAIAAWNAAARIDEQLQLTNMLVLCGEPEVRDVEGLPEKLRALIDGLIVQRRRAEALAASLAACRADAERYACVREHAWRAPGSFQSWKWLVPDQFDAAIDAAMAVLPLAGEVVK